MLLYFPLVPGSEDATPRARIEVFDVGFAIVMTARAPRPIVLVVATVLDAFPQIQLCFGSSLRCRLEWSSRKLPRAIGAGRRASSATGRGHEHMLRVCPRPVGQVAPPLWRLGKRPRMIT